MIKAVTNINAGIVSKVNSILNGDKTSLNGLLFRRKIELGEDHIAVVEITKEQENIQAIISLVYQGFAYNQIPFQKLNDNFRLKGFNNQPIEIVVNCAY
ncbi:hypothetical protein [Photobacterium leiognathi]|uniref:hypothetical protein n=1 Tax=Photobacterium leiognathi TaxID=553611 RepID=UPI0029818B2A|nr:hypothetical protein [Photobacterium leiognathi]